MKRKFKRNAKGLGSTVLVGLLNVAYSRARSTAQHGDFRLLRFRMSIVCPLARTSDWVSLSADN